MSVALVRRWLGTKQYNSLFPAASSGAGRQSGGPDTRRRGGREASSVSGLSGRLSAFALTAVVAASGLTASALPSATARAPDLEIGSRSVAGFAVDAATPYARALRYFNRVAGPPDSTFAAGTCTLRYRSVGLVLEFVALDPTRPATAATCTFSHAVATDRRWRTPNGVGVGASLSALRRAYPKAFDAGTVTARSGIPVGATEWQLASAAGNAARPVLVADVKRGRVAALGIRIIGH